MSKSDTKSMRITITLKKEVYDKLGNISSQIGLKPATWIAMVVTSKVNNIGVKLIQEGK